MCVNACSTHVPPHHTTAPPITRATFLVLRAVVAAMSATGADDDLYFCVHGAPNSGEDGILACVAPRPGAVVASR